MPIDLDVIREQLKNVGPAGPPGSPEEGPPSLPPGIPTRGAQPTTAPEPTPETRPGRRPPPISGEPLRMSYLPGREPTALRPELVPVQKQFGGQPGFTIKAEAYQESPDTAWLKEHQRAKFKRGAEALERAGAGEYTKITGPAAVLQNIGQVPGVGKVLTGAFHYGLGVLGAPAEAVEIAAGNLTNAGEKKRWGIKTPEDERIWQASQSMAYSGNQRRAQFIREAVGLREHLGREPTADELDDLKTRNSSWTSELVGQAVLDPLNVLGLATKSLNAGRRIDEATNLVSKVDLRPIDDIVEEGTKATTRLGGVALEETAKGKAVSLLNPRTGQGWRNRFAEDSEQVVSIVSGVAGKRIEDNLLTQGLKRGTAEFDEAYTLRMGDTMNAVAREWAKLASSNADEVSDAAQALAQAGFGAVPSSTAGRRTAYVLRKLMEKEDGSLGYLTDSLKVAREQGLSAETVVEAWTAKAADILENWIPDAAWEGKGLHGIAKKVVAKRAPIDRVLSTLYMGINPGYAMRNVMSDTGMMISQGWSPFVSGKVAGEVAGELGFPVMAASRGMGKVGREAGEGALEIGHRMAERFEKLSSRRVVAQAQKQAVNTLWRKTSRDLVEALPEGIPPELADLIRRRSGGLGMRGADEISRLEREVLEYIGGPPTVPGQPPVPTGGPPSTLLDQWRAPSDQAMETVKNIGDDLDIQITQAARDATDYDDYVARLRDLQREYGRYAAQAADASAGVGHTGGSVSGEAMQQLSSSGRAIPQDAEELAQALGTIEDEIRLSRTRAFASVFTGNKTDEWIEYIDDIEGQYQAVLNEVRREQVILYGQLETGQISFDEYSDFVTAAYGDARQILDRQYAKVIGESGGFAYLPVEAPDPVGLLRQDLLRAAFDAGYPSAITKGRAADALDPAQFHSLFGDVPDVMPQPHFINKINTFLEGKPIKNITELTADELNLVANKFRDLAGKPPLSIDDILKRQERLHAAGMEIGEMLPPHWRKPEALPEEARKALQAEATQVAYTGYWVDDAGQKVWGTYDEAMAADLPENVAGVDFRRTPDGIRMTRSIKHGGGDEILRGQINPRTGRLEVMTISEDADDVAQYAREMIDSGVPADTPFLEQKAVEGGVEFTETTLADIAQRGAAKQVVGAVGTASREALDDLAVIADEYESAYAVKAVVTPEGIITRRPDGLPFAQHDDVIDDATQVVRVTIQGNKLTDETTLVIVNFDVSATEEALESGARFVADIQREMPDAFVQSFEATGIAREAGRLDAFDQRIEDLLRQPAPEARIHVPVEFDATDFRARRKAAREARLAKRAARAEEARPVAPVDDALMERELARAPNPEQVEGLRQVLAGEAPWPSQTTVAFVDPSGNVSYAHMPGRSGFVTYDDFRQWLDEDLKGLAASDSLEAKQAAEAARTIENGQAPPLTPDPSLATASRVGGEDAVRAIDEVLMEAEQLRRVPPPPPPEVPGPPEEWTNFFNWLRSRHTETHAIAADTARRARDFALLDYRDRRMYDAVFQSIFPWGYWHSRAIPNWATSVARNPALVAQYARYKRILREHNELDPTVPEWAKGQLVINPPGVQGSIYLDLEASLNPLGQMMETFEDEDQQRSALGKIATSLGKFGPAPHPLIMMAYAAERGFLHGDEEAARSLGYIAPATRAFAAVTGKVAEPWLWVKDPKTGRKTPFFGGTKWELGKAGRILGYKEGKGLVGPDEAKYGVAARTGPEFEQALKEAFSLRRPSVLASSILGLRMTHRAPWEQELTLRGIEYGQYKEQLGDQAAEEFLRRYPEMGTVWMAYDSDRERTAGLAWDVLDRIPPGMSREVLDQAGINRVMVDAFYESGGDLSGWDPGDVEDFTRSMISLARVLKSPDRKLANEWEAARDARSALYREAEQVYPGIQEVQDRYFRIKRLQGDTAAKQYANANNLYDYWNWSNQQLLKDPLLVKFYADPIDADRSAKSIRAQQAQAKWPGIYETQNKYYDLPTFQRRDYLKAHPELKQYWNWKDQALEAIQGGLEAQQVDQDLSHRQPVYQLPEQPSLMERQIYEGLGGQ